MEEMIVSLKDKQVPIRMERGLLKEAARWIGTDHRVMLITDQGVPEQYSRILAAQFPNCEIMRVMQGEGAKSLEVYQRILSRMLQLRFSRQDRIIALGGGVVGDLAGFVAATYMRGIRFVNIPTTTLSQIDSSIGGKVAVNLDGVKNSVGAFWQPEMVLIDPLVLKTLPQRHVNNGLVEALKAGLIADEKLVELFEKPDLTEQREAIILRALKVKKQVVEQDEHETGLRKILNFGHTIGHGIESYYHLQQVYHGEAVAIGMMKMIEDPQLRQRLRPIYQRLQLKEDLDYDRQKVYEYITRDKKADGSTLTVVTLKQVGQAQLQEIPMEKIRAYL